MHRTSDNPQQQHVDKKSLIRPPVVGSVQYTKRRRARSFNRCETLVKWGGGLKPRNGKRVAIKNAGSENAGLENAAPILNKRLEACRLFRLHQLSITNPFSSFPVLQFGAAFSSPDFCSLAFSAPPAKCCRYTLTLLATRHRASTSNC